MKNTHVTRIQVLAVVIAIVAASATTLHAQKYTDLYNLGSSSGDPANPAWIGLFAQGRDGNLYSTSQGGEHLPSVPPFNSPSQGRLHRGASMGEATTVFTRTAV